MTNGFRSALLLYFPMIVCYDTCVVLYQSYFLMTAGFAVLPIALDNESIALRDSLTPGHNISAMHFC